ncbi:MAG: tetratricopeptide repeat protein [Phycisphaerae bacterium]
MRKTQRPVPDPWRESARTPAGRGAGRWAAAVSLALALLLAALPAGCRLRRTSDVAPEPSETAPQPREAEDRGYNVAAPSRTYKMSEAQLAIWNDPRFQRRFTQSYIAETEIEPRITLDERKDLQKVLALHEEDKQEEAARLLEKERGEAASAVFDYTLGNIYFETDRLEKAAQAYEVAVDKYPKFRRAWRNLGLVYIRLGAFDKALPALTRTIELGGGDAITYGLLGYAYSMLEQNLPAESAYRMAIVLDPKTMDWRMGLARSFFKQERFAEAVSLCKSLIAKEPKRTDLWLLQANAYIGLEKPMRAAENFELVDRLGGATAGSLNTLGDIYINEEIYDLAVSYYVRAMKKDPEKGADRAIRAAKVLTARSAHDATRTLIRHIEDVFSDRLTEDDRVDLLRLQARLAVAEGKGDEEVRVLEEIVELDPLDGEALILLGQHYTKVYAEAKDEAQAAKAMAEAKRAEAEEAAEKAKKAGDPDAAEARGLAEKAETAAAEAEKETEGAEARAAEGLAQAVFFFERAERLEKHEADALVRHAQLLVKDGKYNDALPLLRRAQQVKPRENVEEYLDQVKRIAKAGGGGG